MIRTKEQGWPKCGPLFEGNIAKIKLMQKFSENILFFYSISIKNDHKREKMALKIFCSAEFPIMRPALKREPSNLALEKKSLALT